MKINTSNRILCNSIPKSGTFLLSRALTLLSYKNIADNKNVHQRVLNRLNIGQPPGLFHNIVKCHWERRIDSYINPNNSNLLPIGVTSPVLVPAVLVNKWLQRVPYASQIVGHVPYSHSFDKLLQDHEYKHLVIIRNPKDVLLSFLHYVVKPTHDLSKDFKRLSEEEKLSLVINGGHAPICDRNIVGINKAFQSILEWKQSRNCLIIKFEDLVGEKGGGTFQSQYSAVKKITEYLNMVSDEETIVRVCNQVFSSESRTFRSGQIGSGEKYLDEKWLGILLESRGNLLKEFYGED